MPRHNSHAARPKKRRPRISAAAVRCPRATNTPDRREPERGGCPTGEDGEDVVRDKRALPQRVLGGGRVRRFVVVLVRDVRAVADRPDPLQAGHPHGRIGDQRTVAGVAPAEPVHERVGLVTGGPDEGVRRDPLTATELYLLGRHTRDPHTQPEIDAAGPEPIERVRAQFRRELGQDPVSGVDQHEADLARLDPRIEVRHTVDQVEQLRDDLSAGKTTAGRARIPPPARAGHRRDPASCRRRRA